MKVEKTWVKGSYKGAHYECSIPELIYLLFKKKVCPNCGGKLVKGLNSEKQIGAVVEVNGIQGYMENAEITNYSHMFTCTQCGAQYSLSSLANKQY